MYNIGGDSDGDRWWLFWLEIGWLTMGRKRGQQSWPRKRDGWSCGVFGVFHDGKREIEYKIRVINNIYNSHIVVIIRHSWNCAIFCNIFLVYWFFFFYCNNKRTHFLSRPKLQWLCHTNFNENMLYWDSILWWDNAICFLFSKANKEGKKQTKWRDKELCFKSTMQ
jgi:hypothetical protein